jgi:hypothetical protein
MVKGKPIDLTSAIAVARGADREREAAGRARVEWGSNEELAHSKRAAAKRFDVFVKFDGSAQPASGSTTIC